MSDLTIDNIVKYKGVYNADGDFCSLIDITFSDGVVYMYFYNECYEYGVITMSLERLIYDKFTIDEKFVISDENISNWIEKGTLLKNVYGKKCILIADKSKFAKREFYYPIVVMFDDGHDSGLTKDLRSHIDDNHPFITGVWRD